MPRTQDITVVSVIRFTHIFHYLLFPCLPRHPHWDSTRDTWDTLIAGTQTNHKINSSLPDSKTSVLSIAVPESVFKDSRDLRIKDREKKKKKKG